MYVYYYYDMLPFFIGSKMNNSSVEDSPQDTYI